MNFFFVHQKLILLEKLFKFDQHIDQISDLGNNTFIIHRVYFVQKRASMKTLY